MMLVSFTRSLRRKEDSCPFSAKTGRGELASGSAASVSPSEALEKDIPLAGRVSCDLCPGNVQTGLVKKLGLRLRLLLYS